LRLRKLPMRLAGICRPARRIRCDVKFRTKFMARGSGLEKTRDPFA
jgi:hypothetical protein